MRNLSSLTRDQNPALELQSINHWTTREVPDQEVFVLLNAVTLVSRIPDTECAQDNYLS